MAFTEAATVITYGDLNTGKSTDHLFSFPEAFFVAQPGALKSAAKVVGHQPLASNVKDLMLLSDVTKLVYELAKGKKHRVVVVDDFSLLCDRTVAHEEKQFAGKDLRLFWQGIRRQILDMREAVRQCGIHVVLNAHESPPDAKGRGGPKLPVRMRLDFPAVCDIVLRATVDGSKEIGWRGVYHCNPDDESYVTRDRHHTITGTCPMNLAEIMRAIDFVPTLRVGRPKGKEWMEDVVTKIAAALEPSLSNVDETRSLLRSVDAALTKKGHTDPLDWAWVKRDAYDRAVLRTCRPNPNSLF